jgi:uncharacterized membrane protein YgcG
MYKKLIFLVLILAFSFPYYSDAQEQLESDDQYQEYIKDIDTTSVASNFDLKAVAEVFRTSKDLTEFEKRLNDKDEGVNNLDLNGDDEIDYLRVLDHADGNTHVIVIQAVIGKDQFQDVASIDVVQEGDKVSLQLVGDDDIYGTDYYIEPEEEEEVKDYPSVQFVFHVGYTPYYSPYYWGYYPPYFHPWPPFPPYYYHRHVYRRHMYHRHHHYHHAHRPRSPHARSVYRTHRHTASINRNQYARTQKRVSNGSRPNSRPSTKPSTRPSNKPNKQPSTRPSTRPSKQPSSKPSTRPSSRPSTQPSTRPSSRPSTQPSTRPSNRQSYNPSRGSSRQSGNRSYSQPRSTRSSSMSRGGMSRGGARGGGGRARGGRR